MSLTLVCFVDIGVHQDGLVHISQITDRYIRHPLEAVSVGDIVDVQVLSVDVPKKRIALTMKINQSGLKINSSCYLRCRYAIRTSRTK